MTVKGLAGQEFFLFSIAKNSMKRWDIAAGRSPQNYNHKIYKSFEFVNIAYVFIYF